VLDSSQLLEKEPEACDDEAEAHERDAGANPSEEGAFGGEKIAEAWFR